MNLFQYLPGPLGVVKAHDDAVDDPTILAEVPLQALLRGVVVQTPEE
jgi:hypothetical protein